FRRVLFRSPSSRDSASATGRATVSATPPGGNGTIIVMARSGYWACPQAAASASTAPLNHFPADGTAMSPALLLMWVRAGARAGRRLDVAKPIGPIIFHNQNQPAYRRH